MNRASVFDRYFVMKKKNKIFSKLFPEMRLGHRNRSHFLLFLCQIEKERR